MRRNQIRPPIPTRPQARRNRDNASNGPLGTEGRATLRAVAIASGLALVTVLAAQPAGGAPARQADGATGNALGEARAGTDASAAVTLDDRWLPWLGCWAPVNGADTDRICVVPDESGGAVLAQTIANEEVTHTARISADGTRRRVEEAGCEGWETGSWSADGRRIFLRSELDCEGGLSRSSSGVLAILPDGGWLDVEVVQAGERSATRVLRHRPAPAPSAIAAEVAASLEPYQPRIAAARLDAGRALTDDDVVEAFEATSAVTVSALLIERGERFALNAATLRSLAEAGVPGEVTDLMIALSYPDEFVINRGAGAGLASARPVEPQPTQPPDPYAFDRFGRRYSDTARYGECMLYDAYYGMPISRYGSGYGCPTFGMRYGYRSRFYGLGGWYIGSRAPVVVRVEPREPEPESRGQLVKGQGYTRDGQTGTSRRGRRRGDSSWPSSSSSRMGSSRSTGNTSTARSSSSRTSRTKASSSSSSSSSSTRRAVRKKKGGGGSQE